MISMGLDASLPPVHFGSDLDRLLALLSFVSDPKACAQRLSDIIDARTEASNVLASADTVKAEIAKDREALAAERKTQEDDLANAKAVFENECIARDDALNDRAGKIQALEVETLAARDEAVKITEDLRLRLQRVRDAAA